MTMVNVTASNNFINQGARYESVFFPTVVGIGGTHQINVGPCIFVQGRGYKQTIESLSSSWGNFLFLSWAVLDLTANVNVRRNS